MNVAQLEIVGYNRGNTPPAHDTGIPCVRGNTPTGTNPGKHVKTFSASSAVATIASVPPMPRPHMQTLIDQLRVRIQNAIESINRDEIDFLYCDPATTDLLRSRLLTNERYALRNAFNANRRHERRQGKAITKFAALECGARYIAESNDIDPEQSAQDRLGANSDEHGDTSRRRALPVDYARRDMDGKLPEHDGWNRR